MTVSCLVCGLCVAAWLRAGCRACALTLCMQAQSHPSRASLSSPLAPPPPFSLFPPPSSQGRCEWESDSGRQITLSDLEVAELSRVELHVLQRIAITQLQAMDIPVSHGMLKGLPPLSNS